MSFGLLESVRDSIDGHSNQVAELALNKQKVVNPKPYAGSAPRSEGGELVRLRWGWNESEKTLKKTLCSSFELAPHILH
jgi:hypothetical protein